MLAPLPFLDKLTLQRNTINSVYYHKYENLTIFNDKIRIFCRIELHMQITDIIV